MDSQAAIPTATVILPYVLRAKAGNHKSIMVAGSTIREIIDALDHDFPGLQFNLCYETGELRHFVNIFLDRENIRYLQGLETPVQMGATIHILQSVAGGCPDTLTAPVEPLRRKL
jgi:molybdopterin synthase sulfur carrier subunit